MKTTDAIFIEYKKLMHKVETDDYYKIDLNNRVNCYVCVDCDHVTKTIDVDAGVTPFMHGCENCGGMARSTFYNDIMPHNKPTQEWYRPSLEEVKEMVDNQPHLLNHVLSGGLLNRVIKDNEPPQVKKGGWWLKFSNWIIRNAKKEEIERNIIKL